MLKDTITIENMNNKNQNKINRYCHYYIMNHINLTLLV